MTLSEKIEEIEIHLKYWNGNYARKELITNNVRITAEAICKAAIIKKKGDIAGTRIILGNDRTIPSSRISQVGTQLNFAELIQALEDLKPLATKAIQLHLELIRDRTNPSSHSKNREKDKTTVEDLEICNTSIKSIVNWIYSSILSLPIPEDILLFLKNNHQVEDPNLPNENWRELEVLSYSFDKRKYQYILVSPEIIAEDGYIVEAFAKMPWRLVLDFNPKTDETENGLMFQFNKVIGQGYKKAFTLKDKLDFDQDFSHYWFLANGQGTVIPTTDYKTWRSQYKNYLSDSLYKSFNKGSRIKSRVVVLLNILPNYAQDIIDEFNRIDEKNIEFILCSESETYDSILEKFDNVKIIHISAFEIANGVNNSLNFETPNVTDGSILLPYLNEDKKTRTFISISSDHHDYLHSLGIEIVYRGVENTVPSDESNAFYKGSTITWRDLAEQKDINRTTLDNLQKRLQVKLEENKLEEIQLVHEAGAGGTTIARRIAYNFSTVFPTIILRKYTHRKTIDALKILYDHYIKGSLPFLIVIESYEVKDSSLIFRDLSNAKRNAVILTIHRGVISLARNKKFILKAQLEGNEVKAFENSYSLQAPQAREKIKAVIKDFKNNPHYISPVLYALTAFGKEYKGLSNYVLKCLEGVTLEQKKLICFICVIYNYTQRSVPIELFSSLFNVDRSKCDLQELIGSENPLFDLLHEEIENDSSSNMWRPRYAILGEEAMKIIIGGGEENKENWKHNLASWIIELIKFIKSSMPYLDDDTLQMLSSLFVERSYLDDSGNNNEFTKLINDLAIPSDGEAIFDELTQSYPDEAHFHGHYARYLYSANVGIKDYDKAIEQAEQSLDISPDNPSLTHTLGMCYREKAENLIYSFEKQGIDQNDAEETIKLLTEQACDKFDECIELDPDSIYGYESQMRVILKTLDFGFKIHHASSKESFITNPTNNWYADKLDKVSKLLEEALFVLEQSKRMDNKERIQKSEGYVLDCEGSFLRVLGKHLSAKNKFEDLVKKTPKGYEYMRPHYRRMFVMCLLASKTKAHKPIFEAWSEVSEAELNQCIEYLDANIFEDPNNTQNIRLWLQAIRFIKNPPGLVSCISKMASWTQVIQQNENSLLEGYYYLYVLNAIKAISEGNTFDPTAIQIVKDVLEKMKPYTKNEKFCYEWYGKGVGIQQMISHKILGSFSSDFFEKNSRIFSEVTGRIKVVNSSQQGTIILDCGLDAFFVPSVGGFTERNTNDRVKFYVGFRYDQIQAWSVILINSERNQTVKKQDEAELKEFIEDADDLPIEAKKPIIATEELSTNRIELPKIAGLKVVGKINLEEIKKK